MQYFCVSCCHLLKVMFFFFFIHYQKSASLSILHFSHYLYDLHIFNNFYVIYFLCVSVRHIMPPYPQFPLIFTFIYLLLALEHLIILSLLFPSLHSPFSFPFPSSFILVSFLSLPSFHIPLLIPHPLYPPPYIHLPLTSLPRKTLFS